MTIIEALSEPMTTAPAPIAFTVLLILMCADVVFGVLAAKSRDDLCSSAMRQGGYHKIGELGLVMVGSMLDALLDAGLPMGGFASPLTVSIIVYLVVAEAVSVMENCASLNPDLAKSPAFKALRNVTDQIGGGEDE